MKPLSPAICCFFRKNIFLKQADKVAVNKDFTKTGCSEWSNFRNTLYEENLRLNHSEQITTNMNAPP